MDIEGETKTVIQPKPENMLLLQPTILESRVFPVFGLEDGLKKMIKIYSEALTLMNKEKVGEEGMVRFSLKSMMEYFESMDNIMYMQKDKQSSSGIQNGKHKTQLQSYDKEFVLKSLQNYCTKKSIQNSVEIASLAYKNEWDIESVLKSMGFAQ